MHHCSDSSPAGTSKSLLLGVLYELKCNALSGEHFRPSVCSPASTTELCIRLCCNSAQELCKWCWTSMIVQGINSPTIMLHWWASLNCYPHWPTCQLDIAVSRLAASSCVDPANWSSASRCPHSPHLLSDLVKFSVRNVHIMTFCISGFWANWLREGRTVHTGVNKITFACIVQPCDNLKVKNALVKSAYYVAGYISFTCYWGINGGTVVP